MAERIQCLNCVSPSEPLFILIIFFINIFPKGASLAVGEGSPSEPSGWMRCDGHHLRGFGWACGTGVKNTDVNNPC